MTLESIILVAQTACVFFMAAWLTIGVLDNIFHSALNSAITAEVLDMTRMREEFPEAYETVAHRRISNVSVQKWLFMIIVVWEVVAAIALWSGFAAMVMAALGQVDPKTGRSLAVLGALFFTSIWVGLLVGGNWFCYWFCHKGAQNTHYQMTLWGIVTMILLVVG